RADRPDGAGPPDLPSDPAVRPDLAARDLAGLQQHRPLELRDRTQVEVERGRLATQVAPDRVEQLRGRRLSLAHRPAVAGPVRSLELLGARGPHDRADALAG